MCLTADSPADLADYAEECSRAALFRREKQVGKVKVVLLFVCVNQRDLRETFGILPCGLIEYSCVLFSRRLRRSRRGMQQAALFRRERQVGEVKAVLWFCGLSAIISVICGRHWGFFVQID